jgi:acyl carrier protein
MFEAVKRILVEDMQVKPEDVTLDAELINDLGINSLELADLILMCEEKFGIEIKDDDIHKFITVGDVVNYLTEMGVTPDLIK